MDEEEKLPLFGVQPEDFYNTEGQGTMGDAMLGGAGLTGAAFAAQTGRAPTPAPSGQMSSLAQRVAANDAANRLVRTTQPQLIGQGQISGPGRPVTGTQLSVPGTQVPATTGTSTQMAPRGATPGTARPFPRGGPNRPIIDARLRPNYGQLAGRLGLIGAVGYGAYETGKALDDTFDLSGQIASELTGGLSDTSQPAITGAEQELMDAGINPATGTFVGTGQSPMQLTVSDIIAAKNARGPDAVFTADEQAEIDRILGARQAETAALEEKVASQVPQMMDDIGAIQATPSLEVAQQREAIAQSQAEAGGPVMDTYLDAAGPAYGGTIVGTTPGGAIEFAPEGEGLIRTMDPTSGEVVFADPRTVARFAEQFREQQLADRAAQQAAITSPEGRAMTERMLGQAIQGGGEFAAESAAREARIAARPDFMEARPSAARQAGGMSMAQARKLSGGDSDVARRMVELSKMGRDPLTGKLMETPEEKALETEAAKSRIAYYNTLVEKSKKEDPDKLSIIEGYADRLGLTGESRQAFIFGQLGGADIGDIMGSGIGDNKITMEMTREEKQALDWAKANPNDPRTDSILAKIGRTREDIIDSVPATL